MRPASSVRNRGRALLAVSKSALLPSLGVGATVLAWWLAVRFVRVPAYIVPPPQAVGVAMVHHATYLAVGTWTTLAETLIGFALTVAGGVAIGTVLSLSRWVEQALYPVLVALNAVPKLAFAPLLIVWLGFGGAPKVVMVILVCFFPVVLTTVTGLTSTPADLVELARSLSMSRWKTYTTIRFRAALPQMFIGFKTGMPLAVIGALVAELFAANQGLGFIIQTSSGDLGLVFAAIAILSATSIVLYELVVIVERLAIPWVRHTTG